MSQRDKIKQKIAKRKQIREAERLAKEAERQRLEQERIAREKAEQERRNKQKEQADNQIQDFLQKNPYIAVSDWKYLKQHVLEICPFYPWDDSIAGKNNKDFRQQQKVEHKEYFDTLLT